MGLSARARSVWFKLFAVTAPALLMATLLMAAGVEVWVRLTWDPKRGTPGFFLSDPLRGQRLAPNYDGWFAGVPVHINSLELRDPREYDLAKRPNTFRILVLGDSVTFGHGSVYDHTYPYLFEQRLKAWRPDIDWQVWNAAVPGYNTSQELAHLLEVGPRFQPDLVIVGFFENDVVDNQPVVAPNQVKVAFARTLSFARKHVYSIEVYKKAYLQLAWRLFASVEYRRRYEHVGTEESLMLKQPDATTVKQQQFTPYDRLSDEDLRQSPCRQGMQPAPDAIRRLQRSSGFPAWLDAVRGFQRLQRDGVYRIVFFLNIIPPQCPDNDVFYDAGTAKMNAFLVGLLSDGTPAVSCYDAFRHLRPSQMPLADGHSIGNSNAVKTDVLFEYVRDRLLPSALPAALHARGTP